MTTVIEGVTCHAEEAAPRLPWSEERARDLALEAGLGELNARHWQLIHTLREHFVQYGAVPPMRLACGVNHLEPHCVKELFRNERDAFRVAGLPEPGSESPYAL